MLYPQPVHPIPVGTVIEVANSHEITEETEWREAIIKETDENDFTGKTPRYIKQYGEEPYWFYLVYYQSENTPGYTGGGEYVREGRIRVASNPQID